MGEKKKINLKAFRLKVVETKRPLRRFLTKLEKQAPRGFDKVTAVLERQVWEEVDCLSCANCCKTMTPTFTPGDLKRISAHLGQSVDEFKKTWLKKERNTGDWINTRQPCQFLNLQDNKCSIYAVRPADCAGFPHLTKKLKDYVHVHKQNVEYCPATHRMVEKMMLNMSTVQIQPVTRKGF